MTLEEFRASYHRLTASEREAFVEGALRYLWAQQEAYNLKTYAPFPSPRSYGSNMTGNIEPPSLSYYGNGLRDD